MDADPMTTNTADEGLQNLQTFDGMTICVHCGWDVFEHLCPGQEGSGLDVERLARAFDLDGVNWPKRWGDNDFAWLARQVAAEYARLTDESSPPEGTEGSEKTSP